MKKVDYFELWEEKKLKPKIVVNFSDASQEDVHETKFTKVIQTPAVLARQAELEAIKNEIYLSERSSKSRVETVTDANIKNRQSELLLSRSLLRSLVSA